ncbi:hypothetical protein EDB89DRAFT_1542390 [Lactarius sanguifluus]|nr:hypothetical protein EDB89DRAFT_1542390 [Lactarius sanguifluus]
MAPFEPPEVVLTGFKERIEALTLHGDRLYIGTASGNLAVYSIAGSEDGQTYAITLLETKKNLTRKAIDQLGIVKDINSLIVLSQSQVTLLDLPDLSKPTPLLKAKTAFSFAVHTSVQHMYPDGKTSRPLGAEFSSPVISVPTVITYLVVGCQRKLVVYSWKDGEAQDIKEAPLPHSARTIAFLDNEVVCLAYEAGHVLFSLATMSTIEIASTSTTNKSGAGISNVGMGAFAGLGGYMSLGLGAKLRPCVTSVGDAEVLIAKDNEGLFVGVDGKLSRKAHISWPAPPEDVGLVKPYIFSILPAGSVPKLSGGDVAAAPGQPAFHPFPVLQVHSSISLLLSQSLPFPFNPTQTTTSQAPPVNHILRLLTPSPSAKSPLFLVSTPSDRATATAEGSSIWCFRMKSWGVQVDELVNAEMYAEALTLLNSIDPAVLPDKERRTSLVKSLDAVSRFRAGQYDRALDLFVELNINPAKVISLYPETVSGRLSVPQERWIQLFGGPATKGVKEASSSSSSSSSSSEHGSNVDEPMLSGPPVAPTVGVLSKLKNPLDVIRPSGSKDPETASIISKRDKPRTDNFTRSVEGLLRYLPDRRLKLLASLEAFHITPSQSHRHASLSDTSSDSLRVIPDAPFSSLTPEQLVLCARVVDTALFKSYLAVRPGLLGPLCRRDNWYEVAEVEEMLAARGKFSELIDLYNVRKMHSRALELLRQLGEKETDVKDRLVPSITYLQRLTPEYMDTVFQHSRWIFDENAEMALEIFTSEEMELPPQHVASFLENVNSKLCARYLEYLIEERHEESSIYHDRLAELYLKMTIDTKKAGDEESRKAAYGKLLLFVDNTTHYRVDRLLGMLPSDDLFETRAILLGRLGRHDSALEIYVYRLRDYDKAERYCKRIHQPDTETRNIFFTLLRIYLRPLVRTTDDLLRPALELIARHGPRLNPEETLQLLPPLVAARDVRAFLTGALRVPHFDARVVRGVALARNEQVARKLMYLEANRVKITDSRICPQCHKRIGPSAIVVHAPGGEVTHYHCREAFSKKLKDTRQV